ncbi:MAG TPA: four helix bundle protein [Vicinamibacteria bacterium]|nr:four helix bundle protein [Vicinamibacteria bacterium]
MTTLPDFARTPLRDGEPRLDAERMDVYQVAREFYALACTFVLAGEGELRDQLRRGALSVLLNLSEGVGRSAPADKRRFFSMARGSATECAAILDAIGIRGLVPHIECRRGHARLIRVIAMLTRLQQRCE